MRGLKRCLSKTELKHIYRLLDVLNTWALLRQEPGLIPDDETREAVLSGLLDGIEALTDQGKEIRLIDSVVRA